MPNESVRVRLFPDRSDDRTLATESLPSIFPHTNFRIYADQRASYDIEPFTYLRDVLTRLPTMTNRQIKDIVPKAWAAAFRNTVPRAA
jgi:hypothetical protein